MIDGQHRPNAEVIAQRAANLASPAFDGLPVTSAIARTATNIKAGGKTPVAGIVHALTILFVLIIAAPLIGYLAMPRLAALLMITAWNMSEPAKWRSYFSLPNSEKLPLCAALILTVLIDLTVAIGVGVALGLAINLKNQSSSKEDWHTPDR